MWQPLGMGNVVRSQVTVVEVPQWRSSGSPTAERLHEGARLLAEMIPDAVRTRVAVQDGNSPADLAVTAGRVREALTDGFVVTVGGDCGVDLAPVAEAVRRFGDRLVLLWFDAHGDLNTPASSPSGAFHGMVLRTLTGDGPAGLVPDQAIDPRRVVLAGARDFDAAEVSYIAEAGVRHLTVADLADPSALVAAVTSAGGSAIYLHIDLDVLDPERFASVGTPAPGGLLPEHLLSLVTALAERFEIAGLGITEYEPTRTEDQDMLAPLVDALVRACR